MATIKSIASGSWRDPSIWDLGRVPTATDKVYISTDTTVEISGNVTIGEGIQRSTATGETYAGLIVNGTLKFSRSTNTNLTLKSYVFVMPTTSGKIATIDIGTDTDPIPDNVNVTINVNGDNSAYYGYYFSMDFSYVSSTGYSKLTSKSQTTRIRNTYLTQKATAGSNTIIVNDASGWKIGDVLLLAPAYRTTASSKTIYEAEEVSIASISGNTITLNETLQYDHGYDNPDIVKAGLVQNLSGNIKFTSGGAGKVFYTLRFIGGYISLKDAVFEYGNNFYNYQTAPLQVYRGRLYGDMILENLVLRANGIGTNKHLQSLLFLYYTSYVKSHYINDIALAYKGVQSGYSIYRGIATFYGGQNTQLNKIGLITKTKYVSYGLDAYQQPSSFNNCIVTGCTYAYNLHDNVNAETNNSISAGCDYHLANYNGSAMNNNDISVYNKAIASFWNGRRSSAKINNLKVVGLYATTYKDYVYYPDAIPEGNLFEINNLNLDYKENYKYYSGGIVYTDYLNIRNSPFVFHLYVIKNGYKLPIKIKFNGEAGKDISIGFYYKQIIGSGTLEISIVQGTNIIAQKNINTAVGDRVNVPLGGQLVNELDVELIINYSGSVGDEILIGDFILPFTADEIKQAKAVWAELVNDNNAAGSFGEFIGNILATKNDVSLLNNDVNNLDAKINNMNNDIDNEIHKVYINTI